MKSKATASLCDGLFQLDCDHLWQPQAERVDVHRNLDVAHELPQQLSGPLNFPAINQVFVPGDLIAIALQAGVPNAARAVDVLLGWLSQVGVDAGHVVVVLPQHHNYRVADFAQSVKTHVAEDPASRAYLMASAQGDPVYVNRVLFDADIVIPIGVVAGIDASDVICPAFCDADTAQRLGRLPLEEANQLIEDINNWLGIFWTIQLVVGPDQSLQQILAGERKQVARQAGQLNARLWSVTVDRPADLIVATLESDEDQSWENASRAILNADKLATGDGAIVLCTKLKQAPHANWNSPAASGARGQLSDVFDRRHVYLISRLTRSAAENSGFGFIKEDAELNRLAAQYASCCLVRDAHRVQLGSTRDLVHNA